MSSNNDVGILAIEVYFPGTYVRQEDLEVANGVSKGKYTIGLGQDAMAFTGDLEDVNSIALSVVKSLMEKYDIAPESVGRLEIGTESLVDKSKSTKTVLMSLFAESGNTDIEGATVINACYGGTAALLNALAWADSSAWDGRYAIVVAADIAVYADGPARPTGGCGSVAMLIGRNAPLKIDLATRTTHATDVWDFFKPNMDSEYPEVNGALSQTCYLQALDDCYTRYVAKCKKVNDRDVAISDISYFLFHSPYNKLVQKSFARLVYQDMMAGRMDNSGIQKWLDVPVASTYEDRELETVLKGVAGPLYKQKVAVGCELSKQIGNTYTASVYMNVANLVSAIGSDLIGKNVTLFSYGSGALASMFSISPREVANSKFSLAEMQRQLDIPNRLSRRECLTPAELNFALQARERSHGVIPFKPTFNVDKLVPGSYYLEQIDAKYVRNYKRKPLEAGQVYGGALLGTFDDDDVGIDIDDDEDGADLNNSKDDLKDTSIVRNRTVVWASGRPNVKVVVTGVAAAVPGRNSAVFTPGVNNIQRIINGESFLTAIPTNVMDKMLEKNVVELKKGEDGNMIKSPVDSYEKTINVVAALGDINLTAYGVSKSIASTMDNAVQVSIAAGLEALKDAGIVSGIGEGTSGWVLPEHLQNTTGIVYATSFPALDTAIEEVSKFFLSKMATKEIITDVVANLRNRLEKSYGQLSSETESALVQLAKAAEEAKETDAKPYEFDRKFLFRVLVLGNSQLAQIIKARGPNMQTNAACAGELQSITPFSMMLISCSLIRRIYASCCFGLRYDSSG